MELKETFKKQGGIKLLKQYWQSGVLFTAINQFLVLGSSRTALELLRLSAELKTKQKLEKQYRGRLDAFEKDYKDAEHKLSNKVWVCWFQGMDNAPELVQRCYKSLQGNLTDREIVLITEENMFQYVSFPDYIVKKWRSGVITHTHMTDLLRLELLITHGGMWVDATVFCSKKGENIPKYYFDSDLFFYQTLKPGRDGHSSYISSWLMSSKTNNHILSAVQYLLYEYWKENSSMADYFLLHDLMAIVLDRYEDEWKKVVPVDNAMPHVLLLRLFDDYDESLWRAVKEQTPFHKLSYKFKEEQTDIPKTFYKELLRQ